MEQNLHTPEIYDFRQHDRLWQRVNPALEPYPETAAETIPARGGQIAVSYTHLDVYKRQGLSSPLRGTSFQY